MCTFREHYSSNGWAISDDVFDSAKEADDALEKILEVYKCKELKGNLQWSATAGNGSRTWAQMVGNPTIDDVFVPKIRTASQGLITEDYKTDKVAFLKGGKQIQAPHYDGNHKGKGDFDAAVSVNYACYEETSIVLYDPDSVKIIEGDKKSIEYKRVYVPKGKAIYFDAYRCLHGGDNYANIEIDPPTVFGSEHLRVFSRFTLGTSGIDYFPPNLTIDTYICTETIRDA
jgi:hypothetical protein